MKTFLLLSAILFFTNCTAQSSFKRLPKPTKSNARFAAIAAGQKAVTAFRFTGPIAGFMYPQNQVVSGLGYGFQRMHFNDSTQKFYVDFSISGVVCLGGNVVKPITPQNITSIGIGLGVLNQLIMIIPCYNLPAASNSKGSIGVIFSISVPLN